MNIIQSPYLSTTRLSPVYASLLCLALLSGCASSTNPEPRPLASADQASLHVVKSEEIKKLMHSLHYEVYEHKQNMLKIDEPRIRYARGLADKLEHMSSEIVEREVEAKGLGLDAGELALFRQYADRLNDHAAIFWRIADEGRKESIEHAVNDLVQTCDGCHTRFRSTRPR